MRASKLLMVGLMMFSLAACAGNNPFAPVVNPIRSVDIYRVELAYATALEVAVGWRKFCWDRSYAVLMTDPVGKVACVNRRAKLRTIQEARKIAGDSVRYAATWVKENPTVSAQSVIDAAWKAVVTFQNLTPKVQ